MQSGATVVHGLGTGGSREIVALRETLERLAAALRRQDDLRRASAAEVTHEMRGSLVGVLARIEALQDGLAGDERTALADMESTAHRLNRLIDDVQLLADAQREGVRMQRRPLELDVIVRDRVEAYAGQFRGQSISFTYRVVPMKVDGDPDCIARIIDNLLTNALRYTDPGGRVAVRLGRRGDEAVLDVEDSGIGIAPEHLQRVFDRFWRSPQAYERASDGSGVGLALVAELVAAHDGRVRVHSEQGNGTTFSVALPLSEAQAARASLHRVHTTTGPAIWQLRGELDAATARPVALELMDAVVGDQRDTVLELSEISFVDSAGLQLLAGVAAHARTQGTRIAIAAAPVRQRRLLEALLADAPVIVAETLAEAIMRLDGRARAGDPAPLDLGPHRG
jgi:anti-anti-sigma factor